MPYKNPDQQKAAQRRHYEANKQEYIDRSASNRLIRRKALASFLRDYKSNKPCEDCGESFHYCVMDFDHVRGTKVANVGEMVNQAVPFQTLEEEIAKCELICSNCHRIRTFKRGEIGGWMYHGE